MESDSPDLDAFKDIGPYSHTPCYREPEENKALEDLESLKDYFLGLWTEVADKVTECDRVRIIQEVVTGTKGTFLVPLQRWNASALTSCSAGRLPQNQADGSFTSNPFPTTA